MFNTTVAFDSLSYEDQVRDARASISKAGWILEDLHGDFIFADKVIIASDNGVQQIAVVSGDKVYAVSKFGNLFVIEYQIHSESDNDFIFGEL